MIRLYINDTLVHVPRNSTILAACENLGIEIPRFCYQESLSIAGNCRSCLVEVFKAPKPVVACSTPVMKDMKVFTDTPLARKARESVLEFLLKSHPLDCAICDQGGECDLQEQSYVFGSDSSRFFDTKRSVEDKNVGTLIRTITTRCIHCTRCVRFATEIAGVESLGTFNRGGSTEIGSYVERLFGSELSGNVIDLCPVGALTSKSYSFVARPWELNSVMGVDFSDSIGSNLIISHKSGQILRVGPAKNDAINGEWISDKARFAFDGLALTSSAPVSMAWRLGKDSFLKKLWFNELGNLQQLIFLMAASNVKNNKQNISILVDSNLDLESSFLYKTFFSRFTPNILSQEPCAIFNTEFSLSTNLQDLSQIDFCSMLGVDPRTEGAILNSLLRKRVLSSTLPRISKVGSSFSSPNFSLGHEGVTNLQIVQIIQGNSRISVELAKSKTPVIFFGPTLVKRKDLTSLHAALISLRQALDKSTILNFLGQRANSFGLVALDFTNISKKTFKKSQLLVSIGFDALELNSIIKRKKINSSLICLSPENPPKALESNLTFNALNFENGLNLKNTMAYQNIPVFFGRQGHLFNMEGYCQKIFSLEAPDFGNLFSAEMKKIGQLFQLKKLVSMGTKMLSIKKVIPQLKTNSYSQAAAFLTKNKTKKIFKRGFSPLIADFFRTDFISRNSRTMLLSSIMHRKQHRNFNKATGI